MGVLVEESFGDDNSFFRRLEARICHLAQNFLAGGIELFLDIWEECEV